MKHALGNGDLADDRSQDSSRYADFPIWIRSMTDSPHRALNPCATQLKGRLPTGVFRIVVDVTRAPDTEILKTDLDPGKT